MERDLNELIEKYEKQWNKNGMGSGISFSVVISDLKKIIEKNKFCKCKERSDDYRDSKFIVRCWHCDKPVKNGTEETE